MKNIYVIKIEVPFSFLFFKLNSDKYNVMHLQVLPLSASLSGGCIFFIFTACVLWRLCCLALYQLFTLSNTFTTLQIFEANSHIAYFINGRFQTQCF